MDLFCDGLIVISSKKCQCSLSGSEVQKEHYLYINACCCGKAVAIGRVGLDFPGTARLKGTA